MFPFQMLHYCYSVLGAWEILLQSIIICILIILIEYPQDFSDFLLISASFISLSLLEHGHDSLYSSKIYPPSSLSVCLLSPPPFSSPYSVHFLLFFNLSFFFLLFEKSYCIVDQPGPKFTIFKLLPPKTHSK